MVEPELSLWDMAALVPIVTEAGGTFTDLAGGRPRPARLGEQRDRHQRRRCTPTSSPGSDRPAERLSRAGNLYPRQVVSSGWCFLAAMIVAYGVANLLQSVAAARTTVHHTFDPGLLLRLAGHRTYLVGLLCQVVGFVLAFLARRDLPLFLVQASVAAGLGVTAAARRAGAQVAAAGRRGGAAGAALRAGSPRWCWPPSRRRPGSSARPALVALAVALGVIAVLGFFAVRLHGAPGSVALGSLAGMAFSAAAVAARPLASADSAEAFLRDPLLYLLIAHSVVGQLLLGLAMQRGSTTAAVAAMDAAGAVPAAIVGLLLLNDRIWPGREWLAAVGFLVTLAAVIGLTRYAEPQHHHAVARNRERLMIGARRRPPAPGADSGRLDRAPPLDRRRPRRARRDLDRRLRPACGARPPARRAAPARRPSAPRCSCTGPGPPRRARTRTARRCRRAAGAG